MSNHEHYHKKVRELCIKALEDDDPFNKLILLYSVPLEFAVVSILKEAVKTASGKPYTLKKWREELDLHIDELIEKYVGIDALETQETH